MIKITNVLISLFLMTASVNLEGQDTIPFTLTTQNNISVETILNKKDTFNFMMHTAVREVSITEESAKYIFELISSPSIKSTSWGGESEAIFIKDNHLQIGKMQWDNVILWVTKLSGPGTHGKFGINLFDNKVIEIDYDHNILILHDNLPGPSIINSYHKLKIVYDKDIMFLEGTLEIGDQLYSNKFMIHSGYGSTILLDDEFSNKNELDKELTTISESQLKDGSGNILKTTKAILPVFTLGEFRFVNLPVSFFQGALGRQKFSVLGNEILRRFNIIIEADNSNFYLKPNKEYSSDFNQK